jgi:2-polyprenyl-6-hydroxyphenyl methylase/3-demethylubiquinone-9 3-methyltransferase
MSHKEEVESGLRFEFGKNWQAFLRTLNLGRIEEAQASLRNFLGLESLVGKRFLDLGCGSGLFSLAAHRMGAEVWSVDFDPQAVACAVELRRRYGGGLDWHIQEGSALDPEFLRGLGPFDVVYSWGVLHHTGDMARAFTNTESAVAPGGLLYLAIYNDQGWKSRFWLGVKRAYVSGGAPRRWTLLSLYALVYMTGAFVKDLLARKKPWRRYVEYQQRRGMSIWFDWVDWVGGYPFEVATPAAVRHRFEASGFARVRMETVGGRSGCNQFVFRRAR